MPHIRSLSVKDLYSPVFDNYKHLHILCHLITAIPKNALRVFESVGPYFESVEPERT